MIKNETLEKIKDFIKEKAVVIKYRSKCKKFNISPEFLSCFACRSDEKDVLDILNIINRSSNIEKFRENIFDYVKQNKKNIYNPLLLLGNLLGKYNFYGSMYKIKINEVNINNLKNFNYENRAEVLKVLKDHLYNYIMNNNSIKNEFYEQKNLIKDFKGEIAVDDVNNLFEDVIDGKTLDIDNSVKAVIMQEYLFTIVNRYTLDDILNNYGFIEYDMQNKDNEELDEKRKRYNKNKNITVETLIKIDNLKILKEKLEKINTEDSKELLQQLNIIDDPYKYQQKIEDIYLEYELLFRNDLIKHLFVPINEETMIDDFRNVRPQMIHCFIRNSEKFRKELEEKIIDKIIRDRNNNDSGELTQKEQERFNRMLNKLEVELNKTQVNYSHDSVGKYTDSLGIGSYKSDTNNQISTSIYSANYFNNSTSEMIGIGFNSEGILPEAIALSSSSYLKTNRGLNNIEYNQSKEFSIMSACYNELIENDGKSEVVLFRRNIDYDTKASYVFVAFNSKSNKNYQELIDKGRKLAKENNMKLVLYDLVKIKESYNMYIQNHNEIKYEESTEEIKIR